MNRAFLLLVVVYAFQLEPLWPEVRESVEPT